MTKAKSHLLKHEVPENVDSNLHFGTDDKKEIARIVAAMGQRQLQVRTQLRPRGCIWPENTPVSGRGASEGSVTRKVASVLTETILFGLSAALCVQEKFKTVYQTTTSSNNNNWLRRKLLEGKCHLVACVGHLSAPALGLVAETATVAPFGLVMGL